MKNFNRGGYPSRANSAKRRTRRNELKIRYLVVTEGVLTEPQYFDTIRPILESKFGIQVINKPGKKEGKFRGGQWTPNPVDVVKKCAEFRDQEIKKSKQPGKDILPFQRCFAVVDYDLWDEGTSPTPLERAIALAEKENICLIISRMKFECWMVWHHDSEVPDVDSKRLSQQTEKLHYIEGKNILPTFPIHRFEHATERATRNYRPQCGKKGPNPSTGMPVLFEALAKDSQSQAGS